MTSLSVQKFSFELSKPDPWETSTPLCGGRRFKRAFSKRDFPLLGQADEDDQDKVEGVDEAAHL